LLKRAQELAREQSLPASKAIRHIQDSDHP
jgi:hypothetical protein